MRLINIILILCIFWSLPTDAAAAKHPNLLLLIVMDGLPTEVFEKFVQNNPNSALSTLHHKGAYFSKAYHATAVTMTAPGHTNLVSGHYAWKHGIVNNWIPHPQTFEPQSIFTDRNHPLLAPAVFLGQNPSSRGLSPLKILTPTLSDFIKQKYPQSNVFAVSAKSRASIPLAGNSGTAFFYEKYFHQFVTSTYYLKAYPKWWADFIADQPFTKNASPEIQDLWATQLTIALIREYEMGLREDVVDTMLVSFSSLDKSHHLYGVGSAEAAESLRLIDQNIKQLLQTANSIRGSENVITVMTSDHGFLKQTTETNYFFGEKIAEKINSNLTKENIASNHLQWIAPYFYVQSTDHDLKRVVEIAKKYFSEDLLVQSVHTQQSLSMNEIEALTEDQVYARHSYHSDRSGSVYVIQKSNTVMKRSGDDDVSSHGTPYSYDTNVPLILSGSNISPGLSAERISIASVLPTLLEIFDIQTEKTFDGNPITFEASET